MKNTIDFSKLHEDLLAVREGRVKEGYKFGHEAIDEFLRFKPKNFNIILGHANVGKTSLTVYLMLLLSLKHGIKWLIYSSENEPYSIMKKLIEYYNGEVLEKLSSARFETSLMYLQQFFVIMDISELLTYKSLLERAQEVYDEWQYEGMLIDPYNSLAKDKDALQGLSGHDYDYLASTMMRQFCSKNNVSIWLNTHAVTEAQRMKGDDGLPIAPFAEQTEGGGKFVNRCDNFLTCHRKIQHPEPHMRRTMEFHVRKIRETETGGSPTSYNDPIMFEMNASKTGFTNQRGKLMFTPLGKEEVKQEEIFLEVSPHHAF